MTIKNKNATLLEGKNINLRPCEISDAEFIVNLRIKKGKFLSSTSPDINQQEEWIKSYKQREQSGDEFYFIIEDKSKQKLGVVRMYDFQGDSFCWGSWLIKDGAPIKTALRSAIMIYEFAFYKLKFKKSHFDVRKGNRSVIKFHESFGAVKFKESDIDNYYNLTMEDYEKNKNKFIKYY